MGAALAVGAAELVPVTVAVRVPLAVGDGRKDFVGEPLLVPLPVLVTLPVPVKLPVTVVLPVLVPLDVGEGR